MKLTQIRNPDHIGYKEKIPFFEALKKMGKKFVATKLERGG